MVIPKFGSFHLNEFEGQPYDKHLIYNMLWFYIQSIMQSL